MEKENSTTYWIKVKDLNFRKLSENSHTYPWAADTCKTLNSGPKVLDLYSAHAETACFDGLREFVENFNVKCVRVHVMTSAVFSLLWSNVSP